MIEKIKYLEESLSNIKKLKKKMKVRIKKTHPSWNFLHDNEFNIGDIVELDGNTVTTKSGKKFNGRDLTKCFSNRCSYPDIFERI